MSKNLAENMIPKKANPAQLTFCTIFEEQLSHRNPLYVLANKIDWSVFENEFKKYYSEDMGRPAKPIRLLTGLIILKHIRNLGDESVVEQWQENSYYQYFCGMTSFVTGQPCEPSELVHFRNRIGDSGMELIFRESVRINGKDGKEKDVCVDTTVQEKNITFPTDNKLYRKIIDKSVAIAEAEDIELRQSYRRTIKKLSYQLRFKRSKKQQKLARKAERKIKTIAGRLVRELERKLPPDALNKHFSTLEIFKRVLTQKRNDSNKIYSLHEPHVQCISKGKEHKKYEFGNKVSIMITKTSGVIVGALSLEKNDYDGHTLQPALEQYKRFYGTEPRKAIADLGYRGVDKIGETEVITPKKKALTKYGKEKLRADHRRRSSIEAGISHLKNGHRLGRNYYCHITGDVTNLLLASAGCNFKRMMRKWKVMFKYFLSFLVLVFQILFVPQRYYPQPKTTF
jgi:IS5 family transposase